MMDQLHLNKQQTDTLYQALKYYQEYVNQPNEMAEDNTEKRKAIKELLEYFENNTSLGVKRYKLIEGKWVLTTI